MDSSYAPTGLIPFHRSPMRAACASLNPLADCAKEESLKSSGPWCSDQFANIVEKPFWPDSSMPRTKISSSFIFGMDRDCICGP